MAILQMRVNALKTIRRRLHRMSKNVDRGSAVFHRLARIALLLAVSSLLGAMSGLGQESQMHNEPVERPTWKAEWISHPTAPLRDPRVFHYRKIFRLAVAPTHFVVHVSADNRFILFVNGKRVGEGPARGDLAHWRYETFDIGPSLKEGENVVAATVWQFGIFAPIAQISDRAAFLMEGDTDAESAVNTDASWQVEEEPGHSNIRREPMEFWFYLAVGWGERIDAAQYDWNWKEGTASATSHWVAAVPSVEESIYPNSSVAHSRIDGPVNPWILVPDPLPPMEYAEVSSGKVVRTDLPALKDFPQAHVTVPAHTHVKILLDRSTLVTAYPQLVVSGGEGSHIRMTYTEALYDSKQHRDDRNEVGNRQAIGLYDEFLPDGGRERSFMPLWWRTWRYVELDIQTSDQPLELDELHAYFTAYPFEERAKFQSSDPELSKVWEICWRSARLDAHETYMDTPYWEQLQYVGDTRVQALISYVVAGDDRLARQALRAIDESRIPEGLTQSRYPTSLPQLIPPFSLFYVNMLHDYWMYRPDRGIITELLPGTHPVLEWFLRRQTNDGFLGPIPYWTFVDTATNSSNIPRADADGKSAILTLLFVSALRDAADMEEALGDVSLATKYRERASIAAESVYRRCWNASLGLLADTPTQSSYSQHANLLAVLLDVIPKKDQESVIKRILAADLGGDAAQNGTKIAHVSYYFQFYLSRAIDHAGLGEYYLDLLKPWRHMLTLGLTTTPEYPDQTRSDSHAWSAHPIYDIPTIVAGIRPSAPGFAKVRIAPSLGTLMSLDVSISHPKGTILTTYHRHNEWVDALIALPEGLTGVFIWKGTEYPLHHGVQTFELK
jgi:hypothetical protein